MPGGRPRKSEAPLESVRINGIGNVRVPPEIRAKAKYVAAQLGLSTAEYLGRIVQPTIERDFREAMPPYESS
jgi:hypothetical protein